MMNAVPYVLSSMTDDLLRATRKLEQATNESWATDWGQFGLRCPHNVVVNHLFALNNSVESIRQHVKDQHSLAHRQFKR